MTPNSPHSTPLPHTSPVLELQDAIRRRAQEIYEQSGAIPGRDLQNWTQAEAEVLAAWSRSHRRSAIVVDVDGVQYVGEYHPDLGESYKPGEFEAQDDVAVRFSGDKMFVRRPNGAELETTIVHKIVR